MAHETWEGSAELIGYGAAVYETYPIPGRRVDDVTGERVDFEISEPIETPGPLGSAMYKQDINLKVGADPTRVQELAMETVLEQADSLSFVTDRRVRASLNLLSKSPSQSGRPEDRSMLLVRRFKGPQDLAAIDVGLLTHIAEQIGEAESDRSSRIARALRWLRRAYLADDEVEEFATMMMGYDGLKSLLPLPTEGGVKKRGRGKKPASKPGINAVLKHWAVRRCGIVSEDWKQVWDLRNDLFHGDLTENAGTRSELAVAIPNLRLALGLALKHVLKLSDNTPPYLGVPQVVANNAQIRAPGFTPAPDPPPQTPNDEPSDSPEF